MGAAYLQRMSDGEESTILFFKESDKGVIDLAEEVKIVIKIDGYR